MVSLCYNAVGADQHPVSSILAGLTSSFVILRLDCRIQNPAEIKSPTWRGEQEVVMRRSVLIW